jgi:hypothetical protein
VSDAANPLLISARDDQGIDMLIQRVIESLGLDDLPTDRPWAFNSKIEKAAIDQNFDWPRYLGTP